MASALVLSASLAGSALAQDGVIMKQQFDGNYCHMKFPAITEGSLASNNPQLKASSSDDVVDFYGPCDESPSGKDQLEQQRMDEQRHPFINYGG